MRFAAETSMRTLLEYAPGMQEQGKFPLRDHSTEWPRRSAEFRPTRRRLRRWPVPSR